MLRSDREVLGRCKGPLRDVSEGYLPIVKAHKHWAQRTFREVRRLEWRKNCLLSFICNLVS